MKTQMSSRIRSLGSGTAAFAAASLVMLKFQPYMVTTLFETDEPRPTLASVELSLPVGKATGNSAGNSA